MLLYPVFRIQTIMRRELIGEKLFATLDSRTNDIFFQPTIGMRPPFYDLKKVWHYLLLIFGCAQLHTGERQKSCMCLCPIPWLNWHYERKFHCTREEYWKKSLAIEQRRRTQLREAQRLVRERREEGVTWATEQNHRQNTIERKQLREQKQRKDAKGVAFDRSGDDQKGSFEEWMEYAEEMATMKPSKDIALGREIFLDSLAVCNELGDPRLGIADENAKKVVSRMKTIISNQILEVYDSDADCIEDGFEEYQLDEND